MKPLWPLTLLLVPLAALTVLAQRVPLGKPEAAPQVSAPTTNCNSLKLTPSYEGDPGNATLTQRGVLFKSFAVVSVPLCEPGELVLQLEPQLGGSEAPRLLVGLDETSLGEWAITRPRELHVRIPRAGRLTLGYFNDYYRSEFRMVTYEQFKLAAPCQTLGVEAPPETGGQYDAASNRAWATSAVPITLKPCAAGTLSFRLLGTSAAGKAPRVAVIQNGESLRQLTAGSRQLIQVPVGAGEVSLKLLNPYFKELADRNLLVRSISFRPTAP